jgi:hypothetical protein
MTDANNPNGLLSVLTYDDVRAVSLRKKSFLKEQLAARCLFQCSPAKKLPANAGTLDY